MMGGVEGQGELGRKDTTLSSVLRTTGCCDCDGCGTIAMEYCKTTFIQS